MKVHNLVSEFYGRVWNAGDKSALEELLTDDFRFQGSLGPAIVGRESFWQIVTGVRSALSGYHCEVLACVSEDRQAFAKMQFSGKHVGLFRNHQPSGLGLAWHGAALFQFDGDCICELWVLSDIATLDSVLAQNALAVAEGTSD